MINRILFFLGFILLQITTIATAAPLPEVTVYKSPTCGCCSKWVSHLKQNGFRVNAIDVKDVVPYKIKNNVTQKLSSCHTALVGGYVIEGHVPAKDILRLLKEKPAVKGLAAPGMPMGSPGMEMGDKKDAYNVVSFDEKGNTKVFSSH
ncbi:MAG: DUF411 domain-containing protein [Gammaproteobacteria bacterium]